MKFEDFNYAGLLKCARYAFAPNRLKYCGPDNKTREVLDYLNENTADEGLKQILRKFETLYPYLKFIALENNLNDPFDERVVEAYWLGNGLLDKISQKGLYEHFLNGLSLKKKLHKRELNLVMAKLNFGALPHHSFHVFNVFSGVWGEGRTLETMDNCRVGWGKVLTVDVHKATILTKPLVYFEGKVEFGKLIKKEITIPFDLKNIGPKLTPGLWLSFHWNVFCEVLSPRQVNLLKKYTGESLSLVNRASSF